MSMLHDILSVAPRNKRSQRKGRGESSGRGKTSGRGNKGAKARVGKYVKRGHEHGQTPIFRRLRARCFLLKCSKLVFHDLQLLSPFYLNNTFSLDQYVDNTNRRQSEESTIQSLGKLLLIW